MCTCEVEVFFVVFFVEFSVGFILLSSFFSCSESCGVFFLDL